MKFSELEIGEWFYDDTGRNVKTGSWRCRAMCSLEEHDCDPNGDVKIIVWPGILTGERL